MQIFYQKKKTICKYNCRTQLKFGFVKKNLGLRIKNASKERKNCYMKQRCYK